MAAERGRAATREWLSAAADGALRPRGRWTVAAAREIDRAIGAYRPLEAPVKRIELGDLESIDTTGAWLLVRLADKAEVDPATGIVGGSDGMRRLVARVRAAEAPPADLPVVAHSALRALERLGTATASAGRRGASLLAFLGATVVVAGRNAADPRRLRFTSTVHHMEQAGLNALPIVGLISFLVGVVLAFQGAAQLQRFGAQVFVVNLIGISVLREIGILLTAIVVAGRSGSAFAAQIGSMKVHEEVDALRALGLDPVEVLVLPRVLALALMMGPLALFADVMGLIGGGLMAWISLDIPPGVFADRLTAAVGFNTLLVGLVKAPVFGALIALIGCYEGLRTGGSADSLGEHTTLAVVEGIFLVIVADAAFSVFFNLVEI